MPTVAIVAGIAILLYYDDHDPAHFHARGAGFTAKIAIDGFAVLEVTGKLDARSLRKLRSWTENHRDELLANWLRARKGEPLKKIQGSM